MVVVLGPAPFGGQTLWCDTFQVFATFLAALPAAYVCTHHGRVVDPALGQGPGPVAVGAENVRSELLRLALAEARHTAGLCARRVEYLRNFSYLVRLALAFSTGYAARYLPKAFLSCVEISLGNHALQ